MVTNLDHTYQHSPNHHNSGKMAIDLTVSRRINNLTVKTKEMENINTRNKAIEIVMENPSDKNRSHTTHFRTQDTNCKNGVNC